MTSIVPDAAGFAAGSDRRAQRLLIAIPTEAHGGCEYNAITFGADLAANYDCDVWVTFPQNETLEYMASLVTRNGMSYVPLPCDFHASDAPEHVEAQQQALWPILESLRPDAVFIPLPWPKRGQGLISATAITGTPALVKFALVPETWSEKDFVNPATKEALFGQQIWFANSAYSSRLLERHYGLPVDSVDHFHVGPIGLNRLKEAGEAEMAPEAAAPPDRAGRLGFAELDESAFVVTTVARLSEQKGYAYLLEAAARLIERHPQLRFVWVGEGDLRPRLEKEIRERGLESHFSLLGFRKDVREILGESDLFVLPTVYEGGCSQALLEAMEERVPVVVSNTSAVGEVITHERDGLLAECRNAQDLELQLERALQDGALRGALAARAGETVTKFSAEEMFFQTRARLEKLMKRTFRPRQAGAPRGELARPVVSLIETEEEARVDLPGSHFLSGFRLRRSSGQGADRLWMRKQGVFCIDDPLIRRAVNIFVAGSTIVEPELIHELELSVNGVPLELLIRAQGKDWRATAPLPPGVLEAEQGLSFGLRMPTERNPAGQPGMIGSLAIRKIAFRLGQA